VTASDPSERSRIARIAAMTRHSRCDGHAATESARAAANSRFETQVDPDGVLPPAERARRADLARRAHMTKLARRSAAARKATRRGER
jgi:hypothetical protein